MTIDGVNGVRQLPGVGSIQITIGEQHSGHDGVYQCLARNRYGVAVSIRSQLRQASKLVSETC